MFYTLRCISVLWIRIILPQLTGYHRRAVAQPCVNDDRLSQWRMAKFDPPADPRPLNRSTKNLKQVITSASRPTVQNFMQICPLGASWQVGEI